MNLQMVLPLFVLFSGEEDGTAFMPLLVTASEEVRRQLREEADDTDVRLCYLVAAVANLRYTQIYGARDKALATYAGTIARQSDAAQQLRFAQQLVRSYRGLCADLLCDCEFLFFGIGGTHAGAA